MSGNNISYSSNYIVNGSSTGAATSISFDPNTSGKFVIAHQDISNGTKGTVYLGDFLGTAITNNVADFVGITAEAITSGATGVVVPQGGVAASVANTPFQIRAFGAEAVFNSATTNFISAAFDPNTAGKFVAIYQESGNLYGTAIVGTVSGNTISFGSESVFISSNVNDIEIAFDPNTAGKFVVCYKDISNSSRGVAVVGTISGTSISYGSAVVFNAINSQTNSITFDPNTANKFIIAYRDGGNNSYGTAIVGTISGTSLSFGSESVFSSANTSYMSASCDPNTANKYVISYRGTSNQGRAIVGTVSGTSISFGTEAVFNAGNLSFITSSFDKNTANKFVVAFNDEDNSNYGTAITGTISGTGISFGTEAVFNSAASRELSVSFHPNIANKFVVAYANTGGAAYNEGTVNVGTVSGTSISYSAKSVFESAGGSDFNSLSFDPNTSGRFIVAFNDEINSNYGTAIVGNLSDALTIGSNYYVQADGSVSTVSTSPAVNIGKAISATSLILKG